MPAMGPERTRGKLVPRGGIEPPTRGFSVYDAGIPGSSARLNPVDFSMVYSSFGAARLLPMFRQIPFVSMHDYTGITHGSIYVRR